MAFTEYISPTSWRCSAMKARRCVAGVAGFLVRAPWNEALLDEVCSFPNAQYAFADALIEMALGSTFTTMENV
jgi:hypothetical protein